MSEPRYNEALTYREYLIATRDELDIEAELLDRLGRHGEDTFTRAMREALRNIDRLALSGCLDGERKRLSALVVDPPELKARLHALAARIVDDPDLTRLQYLLEGLRSPDRDERDRFERLFRRVEGMSFDEARDFLATTPKPKGKKGRPPAWPEWRNVSERMTRIRELCACGAQLPEAARAAADEESTRTGRRERTKYLAQLYEKKQALRE